MSSRFEVEEFCLHFLHGRVVFLLDIIDKYRETYASIDLLDLSVVTLSSAFALVCRHTFRQRPVNSGRIVAVLGFADEIHREYSSCDWYTIRMLVDPLVEELVSIGFNLEVFRFSFEPSYCCVLYKVTCFV